MLERCSSKAFEMYETHTKGNRANSCPETPETPAGIPSASDTDSTYHSQAPTYAQSSSPFNPAQFLDLINAEDFANHFTSNTTAFQNQVPLSNSDFTDAPDSSVEVCPQPAWIEDFPGVYNCDEAVEEGEVANKTILSASGLK